MKKEIVPEAVASLHRYYHCSVEMKYQFAKIWKGVLPDNPLVIMSNTDFKKSIYGYMYMSLWLAFINNFVEGWKKVGLSDSLIDKLLEDDRANDLKIFRHSVFHYQENFWAKTAIKHLAMKRLLPWAKELDNEIERWFRDNGIKYIPKKV